MKKLFILHIFLCLSAFNLNAQIYGTSSSTRRFGYTTSVGQPVNYNSNVNRGINSPYVVNRIGYSTLKYGYQTEHSYKGSYNPGSVGRHGQPRRVKGYTSDGDSINTDGMGNPSDPTNGMWNNGYNYYYDGEYWYRGHYNRRDQYVYEKWSSLFDVGWLIWNWYGGRNSGNDAIQYYQNNPKPPHHDDPIPTPIDDEVKILILMAIAYFVYKNTKIKTVSV